MITTLLHNKVQTEVIVQMFLCTIKTRTADVADFHDISRSVL